MREILISNKIFKDAVAAEVVIEVEVVEEAEEDAEDGSRIINSNNNKTLSSYQIQILSNKISRIHLFPNIAGRMERADILQVFAEHQCKIIALTQLLRTEKMGIRIPPDGVGRSLLMIL